MLGCAFMHSRYSVREHDFLQPRKPAVTKWLPTLQFLGNFIPPRELTMVYIIMFYEFYLFVLILSIIFMLIKILFNTVATKYSPHIGKLTLTP